LRVLMVVESSAGGTGRHVLDLCQGMLDRGCDVHLIYSTGRIDRSFLQRLAGMKQLPRAALPMRTGVHPSDLTALAATRRYLQEFGPFDVIHGHSSKGGALARLAAVGTGVPAFYTLHGLIMMDPGLAHWKRLFYGTIEHALRELAAHLGVAGKVIWLGERDSHSVLAGFDVFAISSRKEGLPYVILEAMSAALPVVATETSGVEILVKTGTNGVVVP